MDSRYHFVTRWRLVGTVSEVHKVLGDPLQLVRWWPAVYLDVQQTKPGDASGLGREFSLYTKGFLPYTLRWDFTATRVTPTGFSLSARGDFIGEGVWSFEQDGPYVNVVYDWQVEARKPLLRAFSFALKPIFSLNHEWAMRKGEQSLRLELARQRAGSADERAAIPAPPGPTPTASGPLLLGLLAAVAALGGLSFVVYRTCRACRACRTGRAAESGCAGAAGPA